jgi:hypothetical protein
MREIRPSGSEGGGIETVLPTSINIVKKRSRLCFRTRK